MTRQGRVFIVAATAALVATTAAAVPADLPEPRLEVGSWIAEAVIQGSADADVSEGRFDLTARFDFRFELLVGTDGAATGSWDTDPVGT